MSTTSANTSDDARKSDYSRWRSFADGTQYQDRPRPGETQSVYNYARTLVRKTASYVFPGPVAFSMIDESGKPTGNNDTEQLLHHLYEYLGLDEHDHLMEIERSTIGDAAEKITWDPLAKSPRVVSVDPATLTAAWSVDNPRIAQKITQDYMQPAWALAPYGVFAINPDQIVRVIEEWTDDYWRMTVPALGFEKIDPNPYGWIPYIVLPNAPEPRAFWGKSDLLDIAQPARDFNRALSTLGRILEMSGAPIAVLENITGSENIQVRPGAKWELPEGAKAYLLDLLSSGGIQSHINYISELRTSLHDISETPKTAFGDTGRALSGTALEIEIQPMVQRVRRKRKGWSRHYRDRNWKLLDLIDRFGSGTVGADRTTATVWPPILPSDDDSMVQQQVQLVSAGIRSIYTANKQLGITDPEEEIQRIRTETTDPALAAQEPTSDIDRNQPESTDPEQEAETDE